MNFGEALECLTQGRPVARKDWNGKRMYVFLEKGFAPNNDSLSNLDITVDDEDIDGECDITHIEGISSELFGIPKDNANLISLPYFCMFNAKKNVVVGWIPSVADILAEDWTEKW